MSNDPNTVHNLSGKAKMGLLRHGKRIYITFEFSDEYEAMTAFDVWSMEEIELSFRGPKALEEIEEPTHA